jgi:hypothetical protein
VPLVLILLRGSINGALIGDVEWHGSCVKVFGL